MAPDQTDIPYVGIDLDNTLAMKIWPAAGIGEPIRENFAKLDELISMGWTPVVYTARPWADYDSIRQFMAGQGYPGIRVICGKPLFARYVGDECVNEKEASWVP